MRLCALCTRCNRSVEITAFPELAQALVHRADEVKAFWDRLCAPDCSSRKKRR